MIIWLPLQCFIIGNTIAVKVTLQYISPTSKLHSVQAFESLSSYDYVVLFQVFTGLVLMSPCKPLIRL